MAEILSGSLTWGSIQQAIVTMDKEGHPLTCCNPVTGECLGGGGSSDFSTAEVTIVNGPARAFLYMPCINQYSQADASLARVRLMGSESETFNAILYKGVCIANAGDNYEFTASTGSIEIVNGDIAIIRGTGTITCGTL